VTKLQVQHESSNAQESTATVVSYSNSLSAKLRLLNPKTDGTVHADAPVTFWSSAALSKYSWIPWVDEKEKPKPRMHRVTTSFEIKWQDFAKLADLVTECAGHPLVTIRSMEWRLTDATSAKMQSAVRAMAARDAVSKAKDYAKALGFSDVKVLSLADHGDPGRPAMYGAMRARHSPGGGGDGQEDMQFTPNNVELSASVSCEFEVVP
jgi:uncharacterized protein YggE